MCMKGTFGFLVPAGFLTQLMLLAIQVLILGVEIAADDGTFVLSCLGQSDAAELVRESLDVVCSKKI